MKEPIKKTEHVAVLQWVTDNRKLGAGGAFRGTGRVRFFDRSALNVRTGIQSLRPDAGLQGNKAR